MCPYRRDPVSEWFDGVAADWLARAYRHPGHWEPTFLAPPSARRREMARRIGADLDERDRWGLDRWTRGFKRAVYYNHKHYGYAEGLRLGDPRVSDSSATALVWEMGDLIRKAGWPTRRRELRIIILAGGGAAQVAASRLPASRRYTADEAYRSMPGPPDRPWDDG